ncbi:hypothetical protein OCGS_2603 [Oceaniovalibus guishaninsula JLT2003]|uniref:Sulfotransferase domain-containing protein n=1 Tax=Oceaniovalibus guishaninsula JLT2003 TaxID=1231392 RepID=K2GKI6_9RHOB|nr:hypothetical protein [Oceaniovalibus guishaninsula]EKE43266.1 hypothetical protein OCGS_2603 [Oceaniovalibus guishaninsula JLT2003]
MLQPEADKAPVVVISGQGRSGSNRLLDMVDLSPLVVCRSEPDEIARGDFGSVGGKLFPGAFDGSMRRDLLRAVPRARARRSARDRLNRLDKAFFRPAARPLLWPLSKTRIRALAGRARLLDPAGEWTLPPICLRADRLGRAALVLKLNACPVWAAALHEDAGARVVRNIRDPFEYLNSWYNRFVLARSRPEDFRRHFGDVPRILAYFGRDDADRLADLSHESLVEIEIWRWRYTNEFLHDTLDGSPRGLVVTYAGTQADPVGTAERLYAFAGLPIDDRIRDAVARMPNRLFAGGHETRLDEGPCRRLIDRVLDGSPLADLPAAPAPARTARTAA